MADVTFVPMDDVFGQVFCDQGIGQELSEFFTFTVPGFKFMQAFKLGRWDGKIRLFSPYRPSLYRGLGKRLAEFCESRGYELDDQCVTSREWGGDEAFAKFIAEIGLPEEFAPRDYQVDAVREAYCNRRCILLSPTSSGKSLIIYLLTRLLCVKTLIVVPTISLVDQMVSDFREYGWTDVDDHVHRVTGGKEKSSSKDVIVSTWQSVYKQPPEFFEGFQLVVGDEAHEFKAKSLISIMEKLSACPDRIGTTGTLDGVQSNELTLEGLFGPQYVVTTTSELVERGAVARPDIKVVVLRYPENIRRAWKGKTYDEEMDFICTSPARLRFVRDLALTTNGNCLILFQYVEKHGRPLFDALLAKAAPGRKILFVDGGTERDDRQEVRRILEQENDAIAVCSYGTFQRGVSIKRIHRLVTASPAKGRVRVLQSLGRGLRIGSDKTEVDVVDVADDLTFGNRQPNHTLRHASERIRYYAEEGHKYRVLTVDLEY